MKKIYGKMMVDNYEGEKMFTLTNILLIIIAFELLNIMILLMRKL